MAFDERRFQAVVMQSLQTTERQFRPDLKLGDVDEWDSVAHLALISEIEEAFGVRFKADEVVDLTSLERLREHVLAQAS